MSKMCVFGDELCFDVEGDFEKYRVESMFDKEPETIAWIDGWQDEGPRAFYDIGANIGIYSLYVAYKHKNVNTFSFEPVASNYVALLRNILSNNLNNISPFNVALSNKKALTDLYLSDLRVGNSGAQIDAPVNDKGDTFKALRVEKVISIALDQLVAEFDLPSPTYIKIDVDGHEPDILNGMSKTLASTELKSMLVEFNSHAEFEDWEERLAHNGLMRDSAYDDLPNHSDIRRQKNNAPARNYIFKRI
jgi:FkbM family methyltransferase